MAALLSDLLNQQEYAAVARHNEFAHNIDDIIYLERNIKKLTVRHLCILSWIVLETEYGDGVMPECILPVKTLEVLYRRAFAKNKLINEL